ncbi:MAG TPA: hypothetical protein DCY25_03135, partial [Bacteroidales bacterium]|nr:hypothetical protein [Bacteroidales bacterium]
GYNRKFTGKRNDFLRECPAFHGVIIGEFHFNVKLKVGTSIGEMMFPAIICIQSVTCAHAELSKNIEGQE